MSIQLPVQRSIRVAAYIVVFAVLSLLLGSFNLNVEHAAAASARQNAPPEGASGYQTALAEAIAQREAAGLPVPSSITYHVEQTSEADEGFGIQSIGSETVTTTFTTTVAFDNPQQAGYDEWPAMVVEDNLPEGAQGDPAVGDYTERYRQTVAEQDPDFWVENEFGQEPRTYTITETLTTTAPQMNALDQLAVALGNVETTEQILMGFTYTGPHIDYTIEESLTVIFEIFYVKAGFELDWGLGLRLPAEVNMSGSAEMALGESYNYSASLTPMDWSASQYASAGVAAEGGNEFVARFDFFAGIKGHVLGIDICPSCYVEVSEDRSTSFTTPFGTGAEFPIPPFEVTIYKFDLVLAYFGIGFGLDPDLGSTNITADWGSVPDTDCTGSGEVAFSEPGAAVSFGPIQACNMSAGEAAQVQLANFKYWFNVFMIRLYAYVDFELFGYDVSFIPEITIANFDLSRLTGSLYLPDHIECDWAFNCGRAGPDNWLALTSMTVDLSPPVTDSALGGILGDNGWYVSDVSVSLSAIDGTLTCPGLGVAYTEYSVNGGPWMDYGGAFTISTEGVNSVSYRSADLAGNVELTNVQTILIDKTPPVITGAPTVPPNGYGWWNTDVTIHFDAYDPVPGSGLASVTPDQVVTTEGENQWRTGWATDAAGNSASYTVTDINIDKTPPSLMVTAPESRTYDNTESFNVAWTASDSLSGIATETGLLDGTAVSNGELVELLLAAAGPHTFTAQIADQADNVTTVTVSFGVNVTPDGLKASLEYMCELGWIDPGQCTSLMAKLNAALAAIERGNNNAARNQLDAFINELHAQAGKHLTQQAHDVLVANAEYVKNDLP